MVWLVWEKILNRLSNFELKNFVCVLLNSEIQCSRELVQLN